MVKQRLTPLERINDPNAVLKLFILFEVAMFVGALLGAFVRTLVTGHDVVDAFVYQMLWIWFPVAVLIAIIGVVMFRRAERKTAENREGGSSTAGNME